MTPAEPLTAEELDELERLAEKATPGTWMLTGDDRLGLQCVHDDEFTAFEEGDAAYIAALSPDVVLRLLAAALPSPETTPAGVLPPNTRLILASDNLLDEWGMRTDRGERITVEWGEPSPEGWYEPLFTVHSDDRAGVLDETALVKALLAEFDGSVCPACHHRAHEPGSCSECPRCELHTDEALAFVLRYEPELLALSSQPTPGTLRTALTEMHDAVCACPFDGTDDGCNLTVNGWLIGSLLSAALSSPETTPAPDAGLDVERLARAYLDAEAEPAYSWVIESQEARREGRPNREVERMYRIARARVALEEALAAALGRSGSTE